MGFTLGEINEAIATAVPEREAIVTSGRRLSWRDFQLRSRRLANLFLTAGLGCRREREQLAPWESGQDHVALYLYNGNEYLEGMVAASKARAASVNVNYRYVEDELHHLLQDAQARAILYHASFAPRLAKVLPRLPALTLLLQVDDGSGQGLLPGALDYEAALAGASDALPPVQPRDDDLYVIYTGGTTGMPRGVLWRQRDIFFAGMGGRMPGGIMVSGMDELVGRASAAQLLRLLPAPPFMHAAGHWSAFVILHQGGTVVLPPNTRRLDPDEIWRTVEREQISFLTIVGDAFARPLVDQLRVGRYDLSHLRMLGSGGALLSPHLRQALLQELPGVMLIEGFGASETGAQGTSVSMAGMESAAGFRMDSDTVVLDEEMRRRLEPGEDAVGWLARRGNVPLGYLGDEAKTQRTYPIVDGARHSVPGDRARIQPDGSIAVLGRDSVCINSGGEKIFAEEVELALKRHPAVYDVVVVGTPSERWGQQVTALVALSQGAHASEEDLLEAAATALARYKLPKALVFVDSVLRAPTGKPDYRWAAETAAAALAK